MKKKRVETFRNIRYGDGRIYYYHYTDSAAAVGPSLRLPPIIGERERANLVVQLARFFNIYNIYSAVR